MGKVISFVRDNWFKLAIAALLLFLVFKKDLNIQMNIDGPANAREADSPKEEKPGLMERLTDMFSQGNDREPSKLMIKPFADKEQSLSEVAALDAVTPSLRDAFIRRFRHVAEEEQAKYGIPASIVLANALLISRAGESGAVQQGLNFFGLGCTADWQGEKGELEGICYRYYDTAWMSFRDHSLYITTGQFSDTAALKGKDFSTWAIKLEELGFRPCDNYSLQVLEVIRKYNLNQWDKTD